MTLEDLRVCHNPILGYSPKFIFFKIKKIKKSKNKIQAGNVKKADQEK